MQYDVVVVGGGPAGLSAAIRLKQLAAENGTELSVCLLEKGAEIGAHLVSGAAIDPRALSELFPDWTGRGAPLGPRVTENRFLFLTRDRSLRIPHWALPLCFANDGCHLASLGDLCRWLAHQAEQLGVEIYPGFAGNELIFDDLGAVKGVATGEVGRRKDGSPGPAFQPGMELHGRYTLFAEGSRGHLARQLEARFRLREDCDPQVYGLGLKELWEVSGTKHHRGEAVHTCGWPLSGDTYGGGFLYHLDGGLVSVGLVVGLGYGNPYLSPFEEFQRFKTHPAIRDCLSGGRRIGYGARTIASGGLQSLPRLAFPGGALIGDNAGFLNAARTKGIHGAIKSGMLAAEACHQALEQGCSGDLLSGYTGAFTQSWLHAELRATRNFKPWLGKGLIFGGLMFGIEQLALRGRVPWTMHHAKADHERLSPANKSLSIDYPKPDGIVSFDRPSSVYLSSTLHEEQQPCHLKLLDDSAPIALNLAVYDGPEQRYCPAGVYEFVYRAPDETPSLQINAANCLHCKACDIKDPSQNIIWTTPQGGDGPGYRQL